MGDRSLEMGESHGGGASCAGKPGQDAPRPFGFPAGNRRSRAWIALVSRVVISGLFLYSGGVKLIDVEGFAASMYGYQLLPPALIVPLAYGLPWLEVWSALVLWLAPPFRRAGWWMITGMLVVFTIAKISAVSRGLDISCGCTGSGDPMTWKSVAENFIWLAFCAAGLATDRRGWPILRTVCRL